MLFSTPPLQITDVPADRLHKGGRRLGPAYIFLHHTGGTDSAAWLSTTSPNGNPVSCHRLIARDGRILKIVPDHEVAYTQGPARIGPLPVRNAQGVIIESANNWGLSIELENLGNGQDYPEAQLWSAARQVVEWWGAYGWLPVLHHRQVQADKKDPFDFPRQRFDELIRDYLRQVL